MKLLIAAAALLMAGPALAGKNDPTWDPPAIFDHAFKGRITEIRLSQPLVNSRCLSLAKDHGFTLLTSMEQRGCAARTFTGSCVIVTVNKTYKGATPAAVRRHELGHCAGWPANHPE